MSATTRARSPTRRPSRVAPSSTSWTCPRPCVIATMFSDRVSIHFTGRPSFRAAAAMTISSGRAPALAPNPPPMSPTTTRISSGPMPSDDAIAARSPKGAWLVAHTRSRPASGTTRIASDSIGTGAKRWLTNRPWIVTSASAIRIDDDIERLEVEPDQLGRVLGLPRTLRNHKCYRLANETDMLDSERWPRQGRRHHRKADPGREPQVGGGQHGHDPWRGSRRLDIDGANRGVGERRPHKGHVETLRRLDVVVVAARAGDEAGVLAPAYGMAENRAWGQCLHWLVRG